MHRRPVSVSPGLNQTTSPGRAQKLTAKARNWSDNATFLVEAEVIHVMQSAIDHQSYPVIFGSALNFTLPQNAEGVSFEAEWWGHDYLSTRPQPSA